MAVVPLVSLRQKNQTTPKLEKHAAGGEFEN